MSEKSEKKDMRRLVDASWSHQVQADARGLMRRSLDKRAGKTVVLDDGREVVEFVNCSYLGLDTHPEVLAGARQAVDDWGVHLCCARSRFTIGDNTLLEERLSDLFGGHAITFPTVTAAHMSVMPLLAAGELPRREADAGKPRVLLFDRFAHASMQYLRPVVERYAETRVLPHNDLDALEAQAREVRDAGGVPVYFADGVYSMGGLCPLDELMPLAERVGLDLYIDDAHGTSIFGEKGRGYAPERFRRAFGELPQNAIVTFSLAKGFGCNGGGVLLPGAAEADFVRRYGQTYAFSAPLDFSIVGAALASHALHEDGTVDALQTELRARVERFDAATGNAGADFSPIRMFPFAHADQALEAGERLIERGIFLTVALFPVVPKDRPQFRVAITAAHTDEEIDALAAALREVGACP